MEDDPMRAFTAIAATAFAVTVLSPGQVAAEEPDRFTGIPTVSVQSHFDHGLRHDRRGLRGTDTVFVYDRGYQGDTAWRAESFNDWWHERPNRSYPAWVMRNRDCQRRYWQGTTLTC